MGRKISPDEMERILDGAFRRVIGRVPIPAPEPRVEDVSAETRLQILRLRRHGHKQEAIAEMVGVSRGHVGDVLAGRKRAHR